MPGLGRSALQRRPEAPPGKRNGYRARRLQTAEGGLRWRSRRSGGRRAVRLKAVPRGTKLLRAEPLKAMVVGAFVRGVSMRDVESLCEQAGLGKLSKSTAARICSELRERFQAFQRRHLYEVQLVALFLDAIYLAVGPRDRQTPCCVSGGSPTPASARSYRRARTPSAAPGRAGRAARAGAGWRTPCPSPRPRTTKNSKREDRRRSNFGLPISRAGKLSADRRGPGSAPYPRLRPRCRRPGPTGPVPCRLRCAPSRPARSSTSRRSTARPVGRFRRRCSLRRSCSSRSGFRRGPPSARFATRSTSPPMSTRGRSWSWWPWGAALFGAMLVASYPPAHEPRWRMNEPASTRGYRERHSVLAISRA
jgi:hypothetical protein